MEATTPSAAIRDALAQAREYSPFLRRVIEENPEIVSALPEGGAETALALVERLWNEPAVEASARLRRARRAVSLIAAIRDLAGVAGLTETTQLLSECADRAIDCAIAAAFGRHLPGEPVAGFCALALGKLGSRELNFSSDVDLILLFDPATLPSSSRSEPERVARRIGAEMTDLLQERTADGFAFRVDLRLRPSPEATAIALPVDAAISHYESNAEAWERAAFIRARCAGGDRALGERFLEAISPFVWRRALDFGAIREVRAISRRIRDHHSQGQAFGPGYDLKRGRGGIREIEFYVQIHQLIHGGREPELRVPATLDALAALGAAGRIDPAAATKLADAYRRLRTVEHRCQMIDDRQTHRLPRDREALDNVARLHGLEGGDALLDSLAGDVAFVARLYDELDEDTESRLPQDAGALEQRLRKAGFGGGDDARRRIEGWRDGRFPSTRSPAAREALEAVLPALVDEFGASPDPLAAINRFDMLLAKLPSAINIFRLLEARPGLGRLLATILSHAPVLADELARRADLLDGLIDASALDPPEPVGELAGELRRRSRSDDYQLVLDRMRQLVGEERFALGVQLIEGVTDPLDVAGGYSRVAEAALTVLVDAAVAEFEKAHGRVPGAELVILALGRLGGEALTHASDLDLVYLFTGGHSVESTGPRPLGATAYFQRLAQRVTAALSAPTAAGPLYDVDTRLRPSGSQGLLAVSLDSFAAYHRENAWTWEHMALARSRPVYGPKAARQQLAAAIDEVLRGERDRTGLVADVRAMRAEIAEHKPPAGPFDVKLVDGGLVDLEFCIHLVQLGEKVGLDPHLGAAISAQVEAGLLDPGFAEAHDLMTRMLVMLRLISPAGTDIAEASRPLVAKACRQPDWPALVAAYGKARHCVTEEWRRLSRADTDPEGEQE